ncbi:stage 0 sporulation protein B (sporulation initiation phosphotransferase) [Thalassobacillus cyri]|uniref:Stage 0 sporulation protein B (Sporulation initiation phosphotransferase) n=1 Tax=Thalassobacillus cyri TaxID=571932 RepID=A0A1H4FD99_9BACI|nr:Spo0B domain-containing protein [Thalassobacillus cyri]SEA94462.1 stage 0 sporulation protein B (sporulation initiation phosphotransferase) [Thalassobacillus cyri]
MRADEVMDLMRHARHDWMNELQLIQGYASMGKMDRVKEKLADVLTNADEERRLMNLNAPYLSIWLMSFNWHHPYYRLTYQVKGDKHDLRHKDITLYAQCEEVIHVMESFSDSSILYHGVLTIESYNEGSTAIEIVLKGKFSDPSLLKETLQAKDFIETVEIDKSEQYHQVTAKMNVEVKR